MTDLITERSVKFIADTSQSPFFLEVAYNAAHWPYQAPDHPSTAIGNARHLLPHDENTEHARGLREDHGARRPGRRRDPRGARSAGLAANTLVIFTNDNGGEWLSRNAPLFDRKFTLYEGGIRVPAIIRWPGRVPAGTCHDAGRHHHGPDRIDPGGSRRAGAARTRSSTASISCRCSRTARSRSHARCSGASRRPASISARSATATGSCCSRAPRASCCST